MDKNSGIKEISVYLITGYLGSGKTTFLNHLLSMEIFAGKSKVLIINEFGSIGIDGQQIENRGDYDIFELNKGSLFCICIKTDFIKTLQVISRDIKPDFVFIEATGIAETRDIECFFTVPGLENYSIKATLCLVDCMNFIKVLPFLKAVSSQVSRADGVILNKLDLVDEKELNSLENVINEINPDVPVVPVSWGRVPETFLKGLTHKRQKMVMVKSPPQAVVSVSFDERLTVNREKFFQILENLGDKILRLKGTINFGKGPSFIEKAGDAIMEKPIKEGMNKNTAFTVIGFRSEVEELSTTLESSFCSTDTDNKRDHQDT